MLGKICAMVFLLVSAIFDIRKKKIPGIVFACGVAGALAAFVSGCVKAGFAETVTGVLPSVMPGAAMLLLSFLTENKVGRGDGILLVILGFMERAGVVFPTFCLGLFFQSLVAAALLVLRKADRQTCIPFAPFLLAARALLLFI